MLSSRILHWPAWTSPPYSLCSGFSPSSLHPRSVTRLPTTSKVTLVAITLLMLLSTSSQKACARAPREQDGDIEKTYDWPLNWELPDLTSDLCKGLSTCHPEIFQLLTSLGRRFISKFLIALLAADGHFLTLLLSTLWGDTFVANSPSINSLPSLMLGMQRMIRTGCRCH